MNKRNATQRGMCRNAGRANRGRMPRMCGNNTVPAGEACKGHCPGFDDATDSANVELATIYFPWQEYREGFCPDEALMRGTLFPELVRTWG